MHRVRSRVAEAGTAPPYELADCPDRDRIEIALAAPRAGWTGHDEYPTLPAQTAALLYSLATSQACIDGNKRVALILVMTFLRMNGKTLAKDDEEPADKILWVAASAPGERTDIIRDLTAWLDQAIVSLS